jgi:hypothetical protein
MFSMEEAWLSREADTSSVEAADSSHIAEVSSIEFITSFLF